MKLPSGAELVITVSPFKVSKALYQAILDELKNLKIDPKDEIDANFKKDIFCTLLSSPKVEACLNECMKKATYNGIRISDDTFEPVEARDDYLTVCMEVGRENITPFTKSLYAQYSVLLEKIKSSLA